ncbi:MAG: hypothetical protein R3250_18025 [Melioribacteraceae bacterium]|nr:hypothetical protein [Melioribacteraceae bacterium]
MPELRDSLLQKLRDWRKEINAQEMTVNPNFDASKADWRFESRKGYYWDNGVVKTN